jgi:type IX secretion system PorP/SprF family membrane protein
MPLPCLSSHSLFVAPVAWARLWALALLVVALISPEKAAAQDAQFSQYFAAPLYVNPAFTGTALRNRVAFNYRKQWPGIAGSFETIAASYDTYLPSKRSGVGILIHNDRAAAGAVQNLVGVASYSYMLPISSKYTVNFGAQAGLGQRNFNLSQLTFGSQVANEFGPPIFNEVIGTANRSIVYPVVNLGSIVFTDYWWVGASAHHVTRPNIGLYPGTAEALPIKISVTAGAQLPLYNPRFVTTQQKQSYLYPSVLFRRQGPFNQLDLGINWAYQPLWVGAYYRGLPLLNSVEGINNQDALILLLGLSTPYFNFGYTYDWSLSRIVSATGGSHEVSLTIMWDRPEPRRKKKKQRALPCPVF